jgi:uncharacterized protein (DUF58 family)
MGAALTLVGIGFGIESGLLAGIALLGLAAVAVGWVELATRRGRLERDALPRRVAEGEPIPLRIRLVGTAVRPPSGTLSDPFLEPALSVGPGWNRRLDWSVHLQGPGKRRLEPAVLRVRDPLGLWSRELRSNVSEEIVVLPRIEAVRPLGSDGDALGSSAGERGSVDAASSAATAQFEVDGLRPHQEGSPASRIHWPAVARSGVLIDKRLVGGAGSRPLVVLDTRAGASPGAAERAMRAAASLCVALARQGGCELLLPGERRPIAIDHTLRNWPEAHVRLAIAHRDVAPLLGPALRGSTLYWVTAADGPPRGLGAVRASGFVVSAGAGSRGAVFQVARCYGRPLGVREKRGRPERVAS